MNNPRTKLTKREFDSFSVKYPSNFVIVEVEPYKELKTSAGINVGFNPDVLYSDEEGEDTSTHVADVSTVMGTVVKHVDKLYFNRKDIARSMSFETTMQLQKGDIVFFHPLISKNCVEIEVEDKLYKVIPYDDLFVARRGGIDGEVICLNGYVVLEEVPKQQLSELDVLSKDVDLERGIVRFNGDDNKRYFNKNFADFPNLKPGDMVVIQKNSYPFYLERSKWNTNFDHGKMYLVVQKKCIMAVISENN